MYERGIGQDRATVGGVIGVIVGALVLWASLVFVPARFGALNSFDPAKRLVWVVMAALLTILCWHRLRLADRRVAGLALALGMWMTLRTLLRPVPTSELGVLASWCLPILLFYLGSGVSQYRQARRIVGGFLLAAGLIQAVLMLLQRAGIDPVFATTTAQMDYAPGRMVGTIGYQNQAVDFLALATLGILLITASPAWFVSGAALMLPVILLTGYRGGILAFAAGVLLSGTLLLLAHPRLHGRRYRVATAAGALALGIGVMVLAIAFIPQTKGRFREAFTDSRTAPAIQSRVHMAKIGWQMFKDRPMTGWGAGEYALQYLDRLGGMLPVEKDHAVLQSVVFAREAHNDPLQFAAEFGLIGLALLAGLIVTGCRRFSQQNVSYRHGIAAVYVFSYMSVAALFSFPWQSALAGPLAAFLVGLIWPARDLDSRASTISRLTLRGFNTTVLFMVIGLLGWYGRDAYLNLAVPTRLAADDADGAARRLSRVDHRYHALVGAAYAANGQYDSALRTLRHAERGYRDVLLWNNLGHVLSRKGEWRAAQTVYAAWAASGLDHANALQNLSVASEHTGDSQAAADSLGTRMRLWPEPVSLHDIKRLAVLQLQAGNPRQAAETLEYYESRWMQGPPRAVAELESLAGTLARIQGDRAKAEAWFRAALERYPELESARRNLRDMQ